MKIVVDVSTKWRHKGVTANGPTEKELKMTIETLIAEFAQAHRALRIAKGYNDYNLDQVVAYACADMLNSVKNCSDPIAMLADEVAFERECLERLAA